MSNSRRKFLKKAALVGLASQMGIFLNEELLANTEIPIFQRIPNEQNDEFWKRVKRSFRIGSQQVYFNNAGLGASPNQVIDKWIENTLKLEQGGHTGHTSLFRYRENVSKFLGAEPAEVCFTRNATEGMNIVANGIGLKKRDRVLITSEEHVGGSMPWVAAANRVGAKIDIVDLDLSGETNLERIKNAVSRKTKVIVCSHVTCTTGLVLPIKELSVWCKSKRIQLCVDGAQAAGMIDFKLNDLDPDYYTASGHKWMFGAKGTGILYVAKRRLESLEAMQVGAYSDAKYNLDEQLFEPRKDAIKFEYGTRNMSSIAALDEGCKFLSEIGMDKIEARGLELSQLLRSSIQDHVEVLSSSNSKYASSIFTFRLKGMPHKEFQDLIQKGGAFRVRGIYENNHDAIRVSCACYNSEEEISLLANRIIEIAN